MSVAPRRIIAQVLSSFGIGGQERVALDLSVELRRRGHDVIAVSLAPAPDGPLDEAFRDAGIATFRVAKRHGFDAGLYARLARLFARERVAIVHTHNPQPLIYAAIPARIAGAIALHTKHGFNPGSPASRWARRTAARATAAFVAVSQQTAAQALDQDDCPPDRLLVIPNGIDLTRFHPDSRARASVRGELGVSPDTRLIGSVGRLDPAKSYDLLIRACAPLLSADLQLVLIGDGPCAAQLHALVNALEIGPFVHLLGMRNDVPRLLAALDVFALSSSTEGLPLVVPEAMACALPVVSTAVGGLEEVIDEGETGYLVPPGNAEALRSRLRALASRPAAAAALGRRARAVAHARYSAQRMANDYLRVYERSAPLPPSSPELTWSNGPG